MLLYIPYTLAVILLVADIVAFTLFFYSVLCVSPLPNNLSTTYYIFEQKKRYYFALITLFLCISGGWVWIELTWFSSFSPLFTIVPVLAILSMIIVAATADYKKTRRHTIVHYAFAWTACLCIIFWLNVVAYKIFWLGLCILSLLLYAGSRTETLKHCPLFWLESAAFYSLAITLLVVVITHISL